MSDVLSKILARKREEVQARSQAAIRSRAFESLLMAVLRWRSALRLLALRS